MVFYIESGYKLVPQDGLITSPTPDVLESLKEYRIKTADFISSRAGDPLLDEPVTLYRYRVTIDTKTGLLPFSPSQNDMLYIKAYPLYATDSFSTANDIKLPSNMGPFLFDAYYGDLLFSNVVDTKLGLQLWDAFGLQLNATDSSIPEWKIVPNNYLVLARAIRSDSLLFWQRISGKFQFKKNGYFQAELDSDGLFTLSSDLLVPKWPVNSEQIRYDQSVPPRAFTHGWVIPILSQSPIKMSVQFDPQMPQTYDIPSNTLTFVRPKIYVDSSGKEISRIVVAIKGSPNSRVEIRNWEYDGSAVESLSYYILGTGESFGNTRWLAGGCSVKPLFFNLDLLKARYSDGVSKYNAGYVYG
jgi:hypothetical protein